jgi:hypothetical protein
MPIACPTAEANRLRPLPAAPLLPTPFRAPIRPAGAARQPGGRG